MPTEADLNLLLALNALLSEGSVAKAAERLGLSESAMSRALARLRAATADQLLVRAGRAMVLTPHALALRDRVTELVRESRAVLQPAGVDLDPATLRNVFTIRANDGFIEAYAHRLVARVASVAPGVRLRFAPKPDKDVRPLREGLLDPNRPRFLRRVLPRLQLQCKHQCVALPMAALQRKRAGAAQLNESGA